jgi:hypothetical protein
MGVPRVWSAPGQVDPLTGLAPLAHLRTVLWAALVDGERLPLVVVVAELPAPLHPVDHARRLTLAAAMAQTAFGSALAVGRLGLRRIGVLHGPDPELPARTDLLARMVHDLPGTVRLEPVAGSPEVADWLLRELCL